MAEDMLIAKFKAENEKKIKEGALYIQNKSMKRFRTGGASGRQRPPPVTPGSAGSANSVDGSVNEDRPSSSNAKGRDILGDLLPNLQANIASHMAAQKAETDERKKREEAQADERKKYEDANMQIMSGVQTALVDLTGVLLALKNSVTK